jgi:hypothetical protein
LVIAAEFSIFYSVDSHAQNANESSFTKGASKKS